MEAPDREIPGAKRSRTASVSDDFDITALPDNVIHRIFDFLCPRPTVFKSMSSGVYTLMRVALSQTCRRFNFYFRFEYVKEFSLMFEFANAGPLLARYPRMTTISKSSLRDLPVDVRDNNFQRLRSLDTCVFCPIPFADWALAELAQACPSLEVLIISSKDLQTLSLLGLHGTHVIPNLQKLVLYHVSAAPIGLAKMVQGRDLLRTIEFVSVDCCMDPTVVAAIPAEIHTLNLKIPLPSFFFDDNRPNVYNDESLRIIGKLPKLTELSLYYGKADWFGLLPMAERLRNFTVDYLNTNDGNFTDILLRMKNLKSLVLLDALGDCETLLFKISSLPQLEILRLRLCSGAPNALYLTSESGISYIGTGLIRRSLLTFDIRLSSTDKQLKQSLIRCFEERVKPMLEKNSSSGIRKLSFGK